MAFQMLTIALLVAAACVNFGATQDFYEHWDELKKQSTCTPADAEFEKERQEEYITCLKKCFDIDAHDKGFAARIPKNLTDNEHVEDLIVCICEERGVITNGTFDMEKNNKYLDKIIFNNDTDKDTLIQMRKDCAINETDCKKIATCNFFATIKICGMPVDTIDKEDDTNDSETDNSHDANDSETDNSHDTNDSETDNSHDTNDSEAAESHDTNNSETDDAVDDKKGDAGDGSQQALITN